MSNYCTYVIKLFLKQKFRTFFAWIYERNLQKLFEAYSPIWFKMFGQPHFFSRKVPLSTWTALILPRLICRPSTGDDKWLVPRYYTFRDKNYFLPFLIKSTIQTESDGYDVSPPCIAQVSLKTIKTQHFKIKPQYLPFGNGSFYALRVVLKVKTFFFFWQNTTTKDPYLMWTGFWMMWGTSQQKYFRTQSGSLVPTTSDLKKSLTSEGHPK